MPESRPFLSSLSPPSLPSSSLTALAMCFVVGTTSPGSGAAQQTDPSQQAPAPAPCAGDEHRQFDFWIGDWDVTNPQGQAAGKNTIRSILGGCVLHESWEGVGGSNGHSYNLFDRTTGKWHQSWVDNSGLLLQLDGGLVGGAMVLEGATSAPTGSTQHRITWSVQDDGDVVRQLWESSTDGGTTWAVAFDGIYRKVKR